MDLHVVGFVPPDDKWNKMKTIYEACEEFGIQVPKEVLRFFRDGSPSDPGLAIRLSDNGPAREWRNADWEGYELDVADIPEDVKTIRFYRS